MRADEVESQRKFASESMVYSAKYETLDYSGHSFRARREKAVKLAGAGLLGRLLDIGGGSGVYVGQFIGRTSSYHLVDISHEMIRQARPLLRDNRLQPYVASVYELPLPNGCFDTVLAMGVLEYLRQPSQALREIARIAKPGARIIVSFTNAHSPMRRATEVIYRRFRKPSPFPKNFAVAEVVAAARDAGLQVSRFAGYNAQLLPFPFTWKCKRIAYHSARLLEPILDRVGGLWGTGFIVLLEKPDSSTSPE